jgi:hypothetical protein
MVKLTVVYLDQFFIVKVNIQIFVDGKLAIVLKPKETKSIELDVGEHAIMAKASIRKKQITMDLQDDRTISINWNRTWGTIVMLENYVSTEDRSEVR